MELLGIGYSCSGVRGQQMVLAVSRVGLTGVSRLGRLSSWWLAGRGVGDSVLRVVSPGGRSLMATRQDWSLWEIEAGM